MKGDRGLRAKRTAIYRSWAQFMSGETPGDIREEVLSSWCRSRRLLPPDIAVAPTGQTELDHEALLASTRVLDDTMRYTFQDSNIAVAIADLRGQIVWTTGDPGLLRVAGKVNFVPGGLWDEASIGVNAMSLALSQDGPTTICSAEHWSSALHDWSCYAAPIRDPKTQRRFGVLNFSTPWDKAHPAIHLAVTALAQRLGVESAASASNAGADGIALSVLGEHRLTLAKCPVRLTRRQTEIVLLLALRPAGVSLAELHADLYGDEDVQMGTLKAEVSHLRHILGGRVSRAPYRLLGDVRVDALDLLEDLRNGKVADAVARFVGPLLLWSDSPRVVRLARTVEVALRDAVLASADYESALALAAHMEEDVQLADHILRILPPGDGRRHILRGHLTTID